MKRKSEPSPFARRVLFWLKASRPGLWFQTLWLYTLPTSRLPLLHSPIFWLGLIYVTFPLNFLVYGWNDIVDFDNDQRNPRKDSFLFGARGSREELASLPLAIALSQAPFLVLFILLRGWIMVALLGGMFLVNLLYNLPRSGWRGRPPLELINQAGYLLLLPLSVLLNQTPTISWAAVGYLVLFCTHSHLMGEVMDVVPDALANRRTSARALGVKWTKTLILVMVVVEGLLLSFRFHDRVLGGFLLLGSLWLLLDLAVLYRDRSYTRKEFQLFGLGINASGFASMIWVWNVGTLTGGR
jgi:4-hydroxybenzoate polyprenyltransferase